MAAPSVLGSLSLGYQLLWNPLRQPVAVQLFVHADAAVPLDAQHLLAAFNEMWPEQAPTLLLSIQSPQLLRDVLTHGTDTDPWVEVPAVWLADTAMTLCVQQARQRGLKLVWRGEPGQRPSVTTAAHFHKNMLNLSAEEALEALRVSLQKHQGAATGNALQSPVVAGQIYENVANRALVAHCLDQQGAWAVAGWPTEDVLYGYRGHLIQPAQAAMERLVEAIDADASLDVIELLLSEEPVLAYRFLRYVNSAGLGLRSAMESIRHGLMALGYTVLKNWVIEQMPRASDDLNLKPIRTAMVMRAHLMERLLDAGEEDNLRREVYLCGLLSQIDLLLGEPLPAALQHLPLPERIHSALLAHTGPYAPYLAIAAALETPATQATRTLCDTHQISIEEVNRAVLRMLASIRPRSPKGLLLA